MPRQSLLLSDFKVNFRLRDFLLDVLACLVPGLIFIIAISIIIGLLFLVLSFPLWSDIQWASKSMAQMFKDLVSSFSTQFWFANFIIFASYFCGHALYRKTPKKPDYISFLRIRDKIFKWDEEDDPKDEEGTWVVEKNKGVVRGEVQFPYSNLKNYLKKRGFHELAELVVWGRQHEENDNKQYDEKKKSGPSRDDEKGDRDRSKSFINKWKIRLAFFYPEQIITLVRNEAHIRLASSVWYASEYIVKVTYFCSSVLIVYFFILILDWGSPINSGTEGILKSVFFIPQGSSSFFLGLAIIMFVLAIILLIRGYLSIKAIDLVTNRWRQINKTLKTSSNSDTSDNPSNDDSSKFRLKMPSRVIKQIKVCWRRKKNKDWLLDRMFIREEELKEGYIPSKENLTDKNELKKGGADVFCSKLRALRLKNDRGSMWCCIGLLITAWFLIIIYSTYGGAEHFQTQILYLRIIAFYLILLIFILFGALFAKHRVEETIHYQRIREVYYVLETAHIADLTKDVNLVKHRKILISQSLANNAYENLIRWDQGYRPSGIAPYPSRNLWAAGSRSIK